MLFLIIIPCVLCFVYAWRRRRRILQGNLPPSCGFSWPIIGLAHMWLQGSFWYRLLDIQLDCLKQGCVTLLYSGINPRYTYYVVCDPGDSLKLADSCLDKTFLLEDSIKAFLGESLVTAPVPIWETRRSFLEPSFKQLCNNVQVVNQQTSLIIEELEANVAKGPFDQKTYMQRVVMRILYLTMFGMNHDEDNCSANLDLCINTMDKISYSLYLRHRNVFMHNKLIYDCSKIKRIFENSITGISELVEEVIKNKKAVMKNPERSQKESRKTQGLADVLIELEANGVYTEEEIIKEITAMIFSGYDTITATLTNVLYLLGSNLNVQEKLNEEIDSVFTGKPDVQIDDVPKLVYLEAVILETLRLYCPVTMISRSLNKEVKLGKYTLEAGSKCLMSLYIMNRHPNWGDDKEEFKPQRWLDDQTVKKWFAAFGLGKRNCIAKEFSLHVMKIILVNILRKYKISTSGAKMEMKQEILWTALTGHHIILNHKKIPV